MISVQSIGAVDQSVQQIGLGSIFTWASGSGGAAPEPEDVTKGGQSLELRQMRALERQQILEAWRQDDEVVALLFEMIRRGRRQ